MHLYLSKEQADTQHPFTEAKECWAHCFVFLSWGKGQSQSKALAWRGLGLVRWLSGEMSFNLMLKGLPTPREEAKPKNHDGKQRDSDIRQRKPGIKLTLYHLLQPNKK